MSKEYVWHLLVGDEKKIWKCVVHEDEVVTYEGEEEKKHLKIMDHTVKQGVLQIDTVTKVYDMEVPFQLERNIPYIKLDNKWTMSATTFEERKQKIIQSHKLTAVMQIVIGCGMGIACLVKHLVTGDMGDWWFMLVLGSIIGITGIIQLNDIKKQLKELEAMEEA